MCLAKPFSSKSPNLRRIISWTKFHQPPQATPFIVSWWCCGWGKKREWLVLGMVYFLGSCYMAINNWNEIETIQGMYDIMTPVGCLKLKSVALRRKLFWKIFFRDVARSVCNKISGRWSSSPLGFYFSRCVGHVGPSKCCTTAHTLNPSGFYFWTPLDCRHGMLLMVIHIHIESYWII